MGFTSYRCTIPRVCTSKQNKVLGNAKFAPLRLRQNNFFPHAVTQAWIVLQNPLVLVPPRQRGGCGSPGGVCGGDVPWLPCPSPAPQLAVIHTWMSETIQDAFLSLCLLHWLSIFLPDFLFCPLPLPLLAAGEQKELKLHCHLKDSCSAGDSTRTGSSGSPAIPSPFSMASSRVFLPDFCNSMALMLILGSGEELSCTGGARLGIWAALPQLGTVRVCPCRIKGSSLVSAPLQCCFSPCKDQKGFSWQQNWQLRSWPGSAVLLGKDHLCSGNSSERFGYTLLLLVFGICSLLLKVYKSRGFLCSAGGLGGRWSCCQWHFKHWEEETLNSSKDQEEGKVSPSHSRDKSVLLSVSKKEMWFLVL